MNLNLLKDFPAPSWEEWKELVIEALRGRDYDKALKTRTYEGILLEPIYRKEDIQDLEFPKSDPGQAPFVRGNDPQKLVDEGWYIAQKQNEKDLSKLNKILKDELNRGLTMINYCMANCREGIMINSLEDLETLLDGIDIMAAPLFVQSSISSRQSFPLLLQYLENTGVSSQELQGALGVDPIGEFAMKGFLSLNLDEVWQKVEDIVITRLKHAPKMKSFVINSTVYENAGASAVQELAFILATAITYLKKLIDKGLDIDMIAPLFSVKLSLGSNFFMEIAKIRAFRLLWAETIKALGGNEESQKIWIHGRTADFNKSVYDLYVNMLRTTTEGFSGVIGGVDSLEITPFDSVVAKNTEFSRRMARNQQLILKEEAHFSKVADPAGGSYYVESLTAQLADLAWKLMQEIEGMGGMLTALQSGKIHEMLEETAKAKIDAVNRRRDVFVGVNMYANPDDKYQPPLSLRKFEAQDNMMLLDHGPIKPIRLLEQVEELRAMVSAKAPKIMLLN
ncbi:MAG TPA: methylmalonyl-CoA mutase, partial [Candidatus Cloacimonetes bacterium]|nr:methylmalonyl-CoA mutase [Candidatus Cloacimonadota bacterium]